MVNFVKSFEALWKKRLYDTQQFQSYLEGNKPSPPSRFLTSWCALNTDVQPLRLVCLKAWISEQRQNKEVLYSWERIWGQSIILMTAGMWWPFNLSGFPSGAVAFFYLQALGTVRKSITWKKNTWNDIASILLTELRGLYDLVVPANFRGFGLDDL